MIGTGLRNCFDDDESDIGSASTSANNFHDSSNPGDINRVIDIRTHAKQMIDDMRPTVN